MRCSRRSRLWRRRRCSRRWRSSSRPNCSTSGGCRRRRRYLFKHALIQEAAYQSLLRSTRQQYHQQIAQVLEAQFPETCEDPARTAGPSLHGGRSAVRRLFPIGSRLASAPSSARPMSRRSVTSRKGWRCSRPFRRHRSAPSKNSRCNLPWARRSDDQGPYSSGSGTSLHSGV